MTKKEIRKVAKQCILNGKTKQETFEELKETTCLSEEVLANIIQKIPSIEVRQKYKMLNNVLIAFLSLTIALKMIAGIQIIIENGIKWIPVLFILPIINILLLIGVVKYSSDIYKAVALFTFLSVLRSISSIVEIPFEPLILIDFVIAAGLIGVSLYLNSKLFPDYLTVQESYQNDMGQNRLREVIKFED